MTTPNIPLSSGAAARPWRIRSGDLRLWSGLVLAVFASMHFANIALGLVSVAAMEAAAPWIMAPWRSLPGTILLYGALLVHSGLALRSLYRRRTLRMSGREAAQLLLGLALPLLLASHVVGTRLAPAVSGHAPAFGAVVEALWIRSPLLGWQQAIALVILWTHVCTGLWFWQKAKRWFVRLSAPLLALAVLIPVLALLGFVEAGKEVAALPPRGPPPAWVIAGLRPADVGPVLQGVLAALVAAVLAARALRDWHHRRGAIVVTYPGGRSVCVPAGSSVLEASRMGGIPHASVCGGRGGCSTCRIRVLGSLSLQPQPNQQEAATLRRFGADPDVRLACQFRPTHHLSVLPIFAPTQTALEVGGGPVGGVVSQERDLAILFCDLRGFTRRAEQWMPFDTVYILNRYFEVVGSAVETAGGHLDKFIGDGALALFGLDGPADLACRQALNAAAAIAEGLATLNSQMSAELPEPLRIAMGLHAGAAIVGKMGYGRAMALTAIGDGINVASRLEGAAKDFDVEAMVSTNLAERGGLDFAGFPQHRIAVRGRVAPVDALLIGQASALRVALPAPATAAPA